MIHWHRRQHEAAHVRWCLVGHELVQLGRAGRQHQGVDLRAVVVDAQGQRVLDGAALGLGREGLAIAQACQADVVQARLALDAVLAPDAILASNTSSLSIAALGGACQQAQRVVGVHFFNPAPLMPLVEIVSGPDIRSSAQARAYVAELRAILVTIGASDGRMEEGSLRVDANVSVHQPGTPFGTRCEIKNLNSLRSLQRAIDYEALRQIDVLESGGSIRQETRHWDEDRGETSTLRTKEEAEDYRYFLEPDLVALDPDESWRERIRTSLPALPRQRREALAALVTNVTDAQRDAINAVVDLDLDHYVSAVATARGDVAVALARVANEVAADVSSVANLTTEAFVTTVQMESSGALTATQAKTVLKELLENGGDPTAIAAAKGFEQLSSDSLGATIDHVIADNPTEWQRFLDGDDKVAQFFIGQVMKLTKGQANGKAVVSELQSRRR